MRRRVTALVFVLASLLTTLAPNALAEIECRPGHWFFYEERGQWYCNPGGDSCMYCWDEIIVRG